MKKLTVKQVGIKKVSIKPDGQTLFLRFPFTARLATALGWTLELPEMTGTWSPDVPHSKIAVHNIQFYPTDETQVGRAFQLECNGYMENFTVVRKAAKGDNSKRAGVKVTEVTCVVDFQDEMGAQNLTAYMRAIHPSTIIISYDPVATHEPLDGAQVAEDDQASFEEA